MIESVWFVYALELFTDGPNQRIKVGISRNPARRIKELGRRLQAHPATIATSKPLTEAGARAAERDILARFKRDRRPGHRCCRELVIASRAEILALVVAL